MFFGGGLYLESTDHQVLFCWVTTAANVAFEGFHLIINHCNAVYSSLSQLESCFHLQLDLQRAAY